MPHNRRARKLRSVAVVTLGAIVGALTLMRAGWRDPSGGAASTDESEVILNTVSLVESADIIVTATVKTEDYLGQVSGLDHSGDIEWVAGQPDPLSLLVFPITEYELQPIDVLKDDGTVAGGGPVTLQLLGKIEPGGNRCGSGGAWVPLEPVGSTRLFFLSKQPDGVNYGLYYQVWSRLDLSGEVVLNTACDPEEIYWTQETSPMGFLAEV